jgi:hypothetical protein
MDIAARSLFAPAALTCSLLSFTSSEVERAVNQQSLHSSRSGQIFAADAPSSTPISIVGSAIVIFVTQTLGACRWRGRHTREVSLRRTVHQRRSSVLIPESEIIDGIIHYTSVHCPKCCACTRQARNECGWFTRSFSTLKLDFSEILRLRKRWLLCL